MKKNSKGLILSREIAISFKQKKASFVFILSTKDVIQSIQEYAPKTPKLPKIMQKSLRVLRKGKAFQTPINLEYFCC